MKYAIIIYAITLVACVSVQSSDIREEINANLRGIWDTISQLINSGEIVLFPVIDNSVNITDCVYPNWQLQGDLATDSLNSLIGLLGKREIYDNIREILNTFIQLDVILPQILSHFETLLTLVSP